jgi:2-oxoglutarate dehydrogenase E2 component (dihydrolipoamide succinyltransferase)
MANIEVILPKMGESVAEATITTWLKSVGDTIKEDESIVEIATDKVDSEVPSPASGIIKEILFKEGDVVEVGKVIVIIGNENSEENRISSNNNTKVAQTIKEDTIEEDLVEKILEPISNNSKNDFSNSTSFYSPLVKSIATKENISIDELDNISGSGANSRVTKTDVLSYLENRNSSSTRSNIKVETPKINKTSSKANIPISKNDEIVEMDRMRTLIADHMVMSKQTSPHVTSFVEADVTNIVRWRNKHKDSFYKREGEKLTFTPIFMEAVISALKDFPNINSMLDGNKIIIKKSINLGMATALPSGNLIVPVIHNADNYNLSGLVKKVNDLANRARNNKLKPEDIQGGTYTLTNVGTFGNVMGTPIINQPQSAILAVGAIRKKPAVIETPEGDAIAIRHLMFLSHAYDHRIIDGALGGSFVRKVADYLEQFDIERKI